MVRNKRLPALKKAVVRKMYVRMTDPNFAAKDRLADTHDVSGISGPSAKISPRRKAWVLKIVALKRKTTGRMKTGLK